MKHFYRSFLLFFLIAISCKNDAVLTKEIQDIYTDLKNEYAPDKRVALFDIQFNFDENQLVLTGETTHKFAFNILLDSIKKRGVNLKNDVRILPDVAVGDKKFAVARNSVINIRSKPKHSAELGTQGLLGMSLKILDKKGDFYSVQTPDNYISWVDKGGITKMTKKEFDFWKQLKKVIFTKNFGYVYAEKDENSAIISDITLGGLLGFISENELFFEVQYPDGRMGFIKKKEAILYQNWLKYTLSTKENIEKTAKKMQGFPYLWGGTSSKGVDCSGFTKMVYLMNGFVIPRDASQQIMAGKTVDKNLNFEGLEKGDLLFFGKKATKEKGQKVTHVGIWLGNYKGEFIHASGNVHLSSILENQANYDEFNKNRYLGSKRYLNEKDQNIIDLRTQ